MCEIAADFNADGRSVGPDVLGQGAVEAQKLISSGFGVGELDLNQPEKLVLYEDGIGLCPPLTVVVNEPDPGTPIGIGPKKRAGPANELIELT